MKHYFIYPEVYDVLVIGAGHAGAEAALAAARLGCRTALLTQNLDTICQMSCNPAIGGLAKGHIVREIDALGGAMGLNTDATALQFRILNASKGPSVRAPRAQCDKKAYQFRLKYVLENTPDLEIHQGTVEEFVIDSEQRIAAVRTVLGVEFPAKTVVLCAGTFMKGLLHVGMSNTSGGRMGDPPSHTSENLRKIGFEISRFKTGTSPRINGRSINFSKCDRQEGDFPPALFSFMSKFELKKNEKDVFTLNTWAEKGFKFSGMPCFITYTNEKTHQIIEENIAHSPMYAGLIHGVGARYCPSLEDKVMRFPDKIQHQIFIEPEGKHTHEYYLNGVSSSLPYEVQLEFIRSIKGLENAEIMRPGYAVEYDFVPPTQLNNTLETKLVEGLFFAGQINGTSGYEEAAAQGLMAGANAALKVKGKPPFIVPRDKGYIGVMIDDLVTKGVCEPYRLFTSRAEYRLLLRQDNADLRLTELGAEAGLVDGLRLQKTREKASKIEADLAQIPHHKYEGVSLDRWLRRPENAWNDLPDEIKSVFHVEHSEILETEIKYSGFLERQNKQLEKMRKMEEKKIPESLDYTMVHGLKREALDRFHSIQPSTLGQASRIPGITPADISLLIIAMEKLSKSH